MDELARELRKTNTLLLLAFGGQIQDRVDAFVHRPSAKVVLTILAEAEQGEVGTAALLTKARERGLARTSFFDLLGQLERAGLVERPRRGEVGLAPYVANYIRADVKGGDKADES